MQRVVGRLRNMGLAAAVASWREAARSLRRGRDVIRRAARNWRGRGFDLWRANAAEQARARRVVGRVVGRMKHARLAAALAAWATGASDATAAEACSGALPLLKHAVARCRG